MTAQAYRAVSGFDFAAEALERAEEAYAQRPLVTDLLNGGDDVAPLNPIVRVGELEHGRVSVPEDDGHDVAVPFAAHCDVEDERKLFHASLCDHNGQVRRVKVGKLELCLSVVKFTHHRSVGGAS